MSLTKTSLGLAHMIASSLADQNVELGTVPNTSVDELTRLSTGVLEMQESIHPAGRANVTMLSMADALEAGASATTDEAHYPHSGAMERFAQNAGRVLASTLDLTQNKVTPMIGRVVEAINRTVTERLQGMDSPLTLVERKDDPMLSSHYLQENVARYAGYPTGMRLRNFGLGACSWNLAGTGHSGMDSEVAEFTNRVGQEKINWVCNALFNGGAANSSEIYGLADQFENSVIAYFLAIQGLTNVPDGINCSLEEWNSYCSQIVSTAGAAIAYVMSRRDKVNATGLLVVSAPLNGATSGVIEVNAARYADYLATDNFTVLNQISTVGAFIMGVSTLPFLLNVVLTHLKGKKVEVDDPWGFGGSLEWATSCPPPRHNFTSLPRIRSERPAFELHHPQMVEKMRAEAHIGRQI